jgi:hypothetical protein
MITKFLYLILLEIFSLNLYETSLLGESQNVGNSSLFLENLKNKLIQMTNEAE